MDHDKPIRESRCDREERRERERAPYKGVEIIGPEPAEASWLRGGKETPTGRRWRATMRIGGREVFLGLYATAEAAAQAHDLGILSFGGAPDDLNFPAD